MVKKEKEESGENKRENKIRNSEFAVGIYGEMNGFGEEKR